MADIKTRRVDRASIKTMDRTIAASHRIRDAASEIREAGKRNVPGNEENANDYASSRMELGISKTTGAAETAVVKSGEKAALMVRKRMQDGFKTREAYKNTAASAERTAEQRRARTIRSRQVAAVRRKSEAAAEKTHRAMKKSYKTTIRTKRVSRGFVKKTVEAFARSARAIAAGAKALAAAIAAGGAVAITVVMCCVIFGAAFFFFGDESSENYLPVSEQVEAYTPVIQMYCNKYGIPEYTELVKAVMMQESGGRGKDPMQASECGYNKKYPHTPNAIKDPEYSIDCGVQCLKNSLDQAKVKSPVDMDNIKLALQGYNFGNGYISWALKKYGGYSKANATEFSKQQASKHGWSSYGDKDYVDHVLRYYPYGNYSYDVVYTGPGKLGLPIKGMTRGNLTSHFGPRSSPGGIGSTNHQGIDIGFPTGTHVLACESGTVTTAGWYGGYGNCIIINHSKGVQTLYGHLSVIKVRKGQKVVRGQYIGNVGSTGNSTGPHLHLSVIVNGSYVNPEKGWLSMK